MSNLKKLYIIIILLAITSSSFSQMPNNLSLSDKIYGLSKFWSEVNYNFVYMYKVNPDDWNNAYKAAIKNIQKTQNDFEYYRELQKLCAILKDGHTQVYLPDDIQDLVMTTMFGKYRLFLINGEGKTIVSHTNKSIEKEVPIGSEVIKVNGYSTAEYQDRFVKPFISSSTEQGLANKASSQLLSGIEGQQFEIEIKTPQGEIKNLQLTHSKTTEEAVNPTFPPTSPLFEFKWLNSHIGYIGLNTFEDNAVVIEFIKRLPELKKAKSIIIDIRNNGGGSSVNAKNIAKYLIEGNVIYGTKNYSRKIIPTDRAIGSFLEAQDTINGKPQWGISAVEAKQLYKSYLGSRFHEYDYKADTIETLEKINVPTVILTGNNTASSSEDFLIYLEGQKNIKRIGEYTNGSTGQPIQISLPGKGSAWICTKKVTYPDGKEFVGTGIRPDILIERNLNDMLHPSEFDSQLDKAIEYLSENK